MRPFALVAAGIALSGCEDGQLNLPFLENSGPEETASQAAPVGTVEQDVEAPDVFSVTEEGLWDGRPSLGGVWVAHPDVADPERVIIRNETTGAEVVGALFRRERDNPGPALQVSSDAAEALGMIAGAPQLLNVVALRREAVPTTPPIAEPDPEFISAETVTPEAPAAVTETPLDAVAPDAATDIAPIETPEAAPLGAPLDAMADPLVSAAAAIEAAEAEQAALNIMATPLDAAASLVTPATSLAQPYIQIGIFGEETSATQAAAQAISDGLPARVVSQDTQGTVYWRVLVGPSTTEQARSGALEQVQGLGFTDAYFVAN